MKNRITDLAESYKAFKLADLQLKNIQKIVRSPLPKKKADRFSIIHANYLLRFRNAHNKFAHATKKIKDEELDVSKAILRDIDRSNLLRKS